MFHSQKKSYLFLQRCENGGGLKIKLCFFFSIFTWEPPQLIVLHPYSHFWARSHSGDEKVCLCFINGCSSPCVLTVNKLPKLLYPGICWHKKRATELSRRDTTSPALPGRLHRAVRKEEPCCSLCNYTLLACVFLKWIFAFLFLLCYSVVF